MDAALASAVSNAPKPNLRGDYSHAGGDYVVPQEWSGYTADEHALWRRLYARQIALVPRHACDEYLAGLARLDAADGIPRFDAASAKLEQATRWTLVGVPGLIPDLVFFAHLANRRFPSTCFIRSPDQLDYLQEPDIFHDIFGHVPMLMNSVFADYMEAYGKGGLKALRLHNLEHLARLYWYTVEFGLVAAPDGIRIYGSGIVSSKGESIYCLEDPKPKRIAFDLLRVMRTRYRIDAYQESYFVIDSFEQLFDATQPDFTPYYAELARLSDLDPGDVLRDDRLLRANPA